jgi:hypothetical protein
MTIGQWFSFGGRIGRKTFWLGYVLPILAASIVANMLDVALGLAPSPMDDAMPADAMQFAPIGGLVVQDNPLWSNRAAAAWTADWPLWVAQGWAENRPNSQIVGGRDWEAVRRQMDRLDPSYRDCLRHDLRGTSRSGHPVSEPGRLDALLLRSSTPGRPAGCRGRTAGRGGWREAADGCLHP